MNCPVRTLVGVCITLVSATMAPAVGLAQISAGDTLTVAIREAPPFVIRNGAGEWSGLSLQLLTMIAADLQVGLEFREAGDLQGVLEAVRDGDADLGASALTITPEREEVVDFTYPYYVTGLGIAVPSEGGSAWTVVSRRFLSASFARLLLVWGGILLLIGFLVWFFERKTNPDFSEESVLRGVMEGFWFSAVTMTTVGYGDKSPKTLGGRTVALLWMFAAVIMISSFTAAVATALTVGEISLGITGPADLPGNTVGTVPLSTSAGYLDERGILAMAYEDVPTALRALEAGQVDAVVYDQPLLQYLVRSEALGGVRVLDRTFETQHYGFAIPEDSPIHEAVNRALLRNVESDVWMALLEARLGGR